MPNPIKSTRLSHVSVVALICALALALSVAIAGCTGSKKGTPQAEEAAYDYAEVMATTTKLFSKNSVQGTIETYFVTKGESDGIKYEIYRAEESGGQPSNMNILIGVYQQSDGEWKGNSASKNENVKHVFTDAEIADVKAECISRAKGNQANTTSSTNAPSSSSAAVTTEAVPDIPATPNGTGEDEAIASVSEGIPGVGKTYTSKENGKSFTLSSAGNAAYEIAFDDGATVKLTFSGMSVNNSGDAQAQYSDDGFGLMMGYDPTFPTRLILEGSTRGSQEYAGYYFCD